MLSMLMEMMTCLCKEPFVVILMCGLGLLVLLIIFLILLIFLSDNFRKFSFNLKMSLIFLAEA